MNYPYPYIALLCFLFCQCTFKSSTDTNNKIKYPDNLEYADLFEIDKKDPEVRLNVKDATKKLYSYTISKNDLPFNNVIIASSTHLAFMDKLGILDKVIAISGEKYMHHPFIVKQLRKGEISDIGFEHDMSIEKIMDLKPELILAYNTANQPMFWERLKKLNIPVIFIHDYLESHPLAKLEWIKLFGILFNKEDEANRYFKDKKETYDSLKGLIKNNDQPLVMTNMLWNDTWYLPGGNSYLAQLIKDAGGQYILAENKDIRSQPFSFEKIVTIAKDADIWLHVNRINSMTELNSMNKRYSFFKAFKTGQVYNNNALKNDKGGILFWETGTIEPDEILADIIHIFNPHILPDRKLRYYKKLSDK